MGGAEIEDIVCDARGCECLDIVAGAVEDALELWELFEDGVRRRTEVDETGDLVDADGGNARDHGKASLGRSEQAVRPVVAVESVIEESVELLVGQGLAREYLGRSLACPLSPVDDSRKAPGSIADKIDGGAQIVLHRLADHLAHGSVVLAHERVQHERDVALAGMAGLASGGAVTGDILPDLRQGHAEHVGQHIVAALAGGLERLGTLGGSEPDGKVPLGGTRERAGCDLALRSHELDGLAAPKLANVLDAREHDALAVIEGIWREDEVVRLPARGEGESNPPLGHDIDDRPILRDPDWMMERQHTAAGAES